ncbi:MAG: DUF5320 domain-containing protein [Bacteroidales bacterium]|jgi:hypothetical protein|nr:DUF5320 domain-containing protein [Bacteroidales bacterium]HKM30839.1 DUF5320 domain-containing protein [Bacteroidales bacterium]
MPRGDKTGPMGQGPMTGRRTGFCTGYDTPGCTKNFGPGRGMGRVMGFGRSASLSKEDEVLGLKAQADYLKQAQEDINRRLGELENAE